MPVVQTGLIYVLIPAAIYGVIALLTLWPKAARATRYRSGQPWTYDPVWWRATGVAAGHEQQESAPAEAAERTARGGARGNW